MSLDPKQVRQDEAAFVALYARQKEALIAQAQRLLAHARSQPPTERARVTLGDTVVELVRGPSGWRLTAPVGSPPPPE